ncbi:MAG: type 4a pilus biogenesis protein PilO [bacterium]|nr:type 4a pilus biogenesis protein PilO [bacterium]
MNRTLYIGILVAGAVGIGTVFTWPSWQDYQLLATQLRERQQELENREAYYADLREIAERLSEFPEELAKVEAAIPDDPGLPSLYDFMQSEAALSGMNLRTISALIDSKGEGVQEMQVIPVTLELSGSYGAAKEFLSRLKVASRMTSLQSLNVSGAQESGLFNVTLQLHAYSY